MGGEFELVGWFGHGIQRRVLRAGYVMRDAIGRVVVAALLLVTLAACSPPTSPDPSTSGPPPMAPWVPTQTIVVTPMSDDEAMQLRAKSLEELAQFRGVTDPPDVALIRWTSWDDVGSVVAACLRDAGFSAIGAGTIIMNPGGIPPSQASAYGLADYVCNAEYTVHPKYAVPLTADQWGMVYDYDTQWEVVCVAGFGVTASAPPTRETFVAESLQKGVAPWDPWGEAQQAFASSSQKMVSMTQACPPLPAAQYLWG